MSSTPDPKHELKRAIGQWDLLLFNVASVLGPRWIAAASTFCNIARPE